MPTDHNAAHSPLAAAVLRRLSQPRIEDYLRQCGGDPDSALRLYGWNTAISGAFWETLSHVEVVLRNSLADRLQQRHTARHRPGSWLAGPAGELDRRANREIAEAHRRVTRKRKPSSDGQIISELGLGFWRFLLATRYATTLWPDLATAFPHAPDRARATIEQPVTRLHLLRNRIAHHERIWNQPLADCYADIGLLLGCIDPHARDWALQLCRVPNVLATCPITRPYP